MTVESVVWTRPAYQEALVSLGLSPKVAESITHAWPEPASLAAATAAQLRRQGLTPAQARRLLGAVDLARLATRTPAGPQLRGPADVAAILAPMLAMAEHEIGVVLMLDGRRRVIDANVYTSGSTTEVPIDVAAVFRGAIRAAAAGVIVAHNHPAGDPTPSDGDIHFTARLVELGRLLGIPLLDHVIIARGGVCSILGKGVLPLV
jgi:DNA repair protein RadC